MKLLAHLFRGNELNTAFTHCTQTNRFAGLRYIISYYKLMIIMKWNPTLKLKLPNIDEYAYNVWINDY